MPATYSHRYTWEQIQKKYYTNQLKPREDIGPKEYQIFGYEVDAATYKKFNRQDYRVAFGFHGLKIVELWATDPEYVKQYPEEAAKAKAIMADIITQITGKGKDDKNMKEPRTAADFIAALNGIYTESRATMLRIIGNFARNLRGEKGKAMSYDDGLICTKVANAGDCAKDGSRELAIFDSAVSAAAYGLGKDYPHATRMHGHVTGWMEGFKDQITNLPVTPAETNGDAGAGGGEE